MHNTIACEQCISAAYANVMRYLEKHNERKNPVVTTKMLIQMFMHELQHADVQNSGEFQGEFTHR